MSMTVTNVSRCYGRKSALQDVTFSLESGDIACLIGPSGAGKSTLLNILAGLDKGYSGVLEAKPPLTREHPAILVFQEHLLFPHMSVFENAAFGLRSRGMEKSEISRRVSEVLEYFGLGDRGNSRPHELSGGQKQRVALARALVIRPALLLLDEPFASLDKNLKRDTAEFLRRTTLDFGITTLAVSHDLEEAFILADKIGLLKEGRLVQFGTVDDLFFRPADWESARFLGPVNVFEPDEARRLGFCDAAKESLAFRAESLEPVADPEGPLVITGRRFHGRLYHYQVALDGKVFEAVSLTDGLSPGDRVRFSIRKDHQPLGGKRDE